LNDSKIHFIIIRSCIFICAFIYLDSYVIPLKDSTEIIKDKNYYENKTRRSKFKTYYIETTNKKFDASESFYNYSTVADTVILHSSPITRSIQKASVIRGEYSYSFEIGYVRTSTSFIYISVLLIILILFHIFYFSIKWPPGRRNLLITVIIGTLLVFFFHLGITFQ
jgi:hypothetical protein